MARIRTIKPDAFMSHSLSYVPREVRWTFAGLWTYADDKGRARDDVRLIKAALYALDDSVSLATLASELDRLASDEVSCICRYEVDSRTYFHVLNWKQHQHINRPTPSKIPACPKPHDEDSVSEPGPPVEDSLKAPGGLTEDSRQEGKGREQGKEGKRATTRTPSPTPDTWTGPTDKHTAQAKELDLDLKFETDKFLDSWRARGVKYKDPDAAFRNWLRQSAKWGGSSYSPNTAPAPAARHVPLEVPAHIDPDDGPAYAAWLRAEAK